MIDIYLKEIIKSTIKNDIQAEILIRNLNSLLEENEWDTKADKKDGFYSLQIIEYGVGNNDEIIEIHLFEKYNYQTVEKLIEDLKIQTEYEKWF